MDADKWNAFFFKLRHDLSYIDKNDLIPSQLLRFNDISKCIHGDSKYNDPDCPAEETDDMSRAKGSFEKVVTEVISGFFVKHKVAAPLLIFSMLAGGSFVSFDQFSNMSGGSNDVAASEILSDHTVDLREIHIVLTEHSKILRDVSMYIKESNQISQKMLIEQAKITTRIQDIREDVRDLKYKK